MKIKKCFLLEQVLKGLEVPYNYFNVLMTSLEDKMESLKEPKEPKLALRGAGLATKMDFVLQRKNVVHNKRPTVKCCTELR